MELFCVAPAVSVELLLPVICKYWAGKKGIIVKIQRKGIRLKGFVFAAEGKILAKAILERIKECLESLIDRNQAHCHSGFFCTNHINTHCC